MLDKRTHPGKSPRMNKDSCSWNLKNFVAGMVKPLAVSDCNHEYRQLTDMIVKQGVTRPTKKVKKVLSQSAEWKPNESNKPLSKQQKKD